MNKIGKIRLPHKLAAALLTLSLILCSCSISGEKDNSGSNSISDNRNNPTVSTDSNDSKIMPTTGGYKETIWTIERDMLESSLPIVISEEPVPTVGVIVYTADEWGNDARQIQGVEETEMLFYTTQNGSEWHLEENHPLSKLSGKTSIIDYQMIDEEIFVLFTKNVDVESTYHFGRISKDGSFYELPINLGNYPDYTMQYDIIEGKSRVDTSGSNGFSNEPGSRPEREQPVSCFYVLDKSILVANNSKIKKYNLDGTLELEYGTSEHSFLILGDEIISVNIDGTMIKIIDIETGVVKREINSGLPEKVLAITADASGTVHILTRKGIYKSTNNFSTWDIVLPSERTSIEDFSVSLTKMSITKEGDFIVSGFRSFQTGYVPSTILHYTFDEKMTNTIVNTLRIMTLEENENIQNAALIFQKENPNIAVEITVLKDLYPDISQENIINTLNTQIMAGDGPDILVLDNLPMQSYIKNDLLYDLTKNLPQIINSQEGYFENILFSHKNDSGLYAIPTSFSLPVATSYAFPGGVIDMELYQNSESESDFLDLGEGRFVIADDEYDIPVECAVYPKSASLSLSNIAQWTNTNNNTFYVNTPMQVASDFYASEFPRFYPGGSFNKDVFSDYLINVSTLCNNNRNTSHRTTDSIILLSDGHSSNAKQTDDLDFSIDKALAVSNHEAQVDVRKLDGFLDLMLLDGITYDMKDSYIAQTPNAPFDMYSLDTRESFHLLGDVFIPQGTVGVLKSSNNIDLATDFISILFSEEVQNKMLDTGFPLLKSCYKRNLWLEIYYVVTVEKNGKRDVTTNSWPLPLMMMMFTNAVESLETPYISNEIVEEKIVDIVAQYATNTISLDEALSQAEHVYLQRGW